jgi:hypothetical protein
VWHQRFVGLQFVTAWKTFRHPECLRRTGLISFDSRTWTTKSRSWFGNSGASFIRRIVERTGVKIDVEDDGRINIASSDDVAAQKAIAIIQELTATPEQDKVYMAASSASPTSVHSSKRCPA